MSFSKKIEQEALAKSIGVFRIDSLDGNDESKYVFLGVRLDKFEALKTAMESGVEFEPRDYGIVIIEGYGELTDAVKRMLTEDYGYNHELAANIPLGDSKED
jgi:hypothetical protein